MARGGVAERTPWRVLRNETEPGRYLPYVRHVDPHVVALENRDLMTMFRLDGLSFETADPADLNDWHEKLNGVLRNIADDRLALWTHIVRHDVADYPEGRFRSAFAAALDARYRERVTARRMFVNEIYLTLVMRPAAGSADRTAVLLKRISQARREDEEIDADELLRFEEKARDTVKLLGRCAPRRLGTYEHGGIMFSEPMEVLEMVMMGTHRRVPLVRGHLGGALYGERLIFGRETIEVRAHDRSRYIGMFGIREYPAATRPGQLNALLSADFPLVVSQSFAFMGKARAAERLRRRQNQMASTEDAASSQAEDLIAAADDLQSNRFVLGEHHFSLAVFGDSIRRLNDNLSGARAALADAGLVSAREGPALEAAFWSQLPGNFAWRSRPAAITSRNFAALSPFHTYPSGKASGNHWGQAVALLKTAAQSPYYFNFHRADIGHTLIIGPTGTGKTVVQNFLMAQLEKTGAQQIFIDKDRGAEIYVRASGGTYLTLRNGEPTGFAPLKGLDDSPRNLVFLEKLIRQLVTPRNGTLNVTEERRISDGLVSLSRLPADQRSFGALRQLLGQRDAEGIGARLEKWCQGGALGWVFDNEKDALSLDARFIGFDMTDFLENPEIRSPVMLYLFHRIDALLTGQPLVLDIDEVWRPLEDVGFQEFAQDGLKTYRKLNAFFVFGTQSPADTLKSPIAHSIIEQMATKIILPNPNGNPDDYIKGLGLTRKEYDLIRHELIPEQRRFLVKQGHDSIVVELDLGGLDDELAVLSGTAETVALLDAIRAEVGDDPAIWLPIFHQRRRSPKVSKG
ncbi:VirB4 family type IV secretion/conjugal transfer ATPase [Novosphingobium panipatense]|uniref:Type IV secretion system protein virB4 n=1 Tax=Novosphingobium panipatense TaxID=428991 RepID=A0ABY1QUQ0_9SPHN|nr:VirB4 family type IV secretion/conjugal transfer ATPase [Novosphingobium panipatense]SMP80771.1 type IV secretion system protein VirB4 [Novosphingobium panipatense]